MSIESRGAVGLARSVGARAEVALVRSNTRTQYVDRVSGKPAFGFSTMLTLVLVRRADGWKMHQGHASSPGTHTTP